MSGYLLPVFYAVLQLVLLIGAGFAARRIGSWSDDFFRGLSRFVVRVALPLYFVVRVGRTDVSDIGQLALLPVAAISVIAVGLGLSAAVFGLLPFTGANRRAGIAMGTFGNSGYMPLTLGEVVPISVPAIATLIDVELVSVMVAAYVFAFSPLLWSAGSVIITRPDGASSRFSLRDLLSPPLIGILVGLLVSLSGLGALASDPELPVFHVFEAIDRLSATTLPLALISLGALIGGLRVPSGAFGHYLGLAATVFALRYLALPALFFGLYLSGALQALAPAALFVLFLETHTPPATNFSLMVGESGVNTEHTAVTLLVCYVGYLVVMPIYLTLFLTLLAA